MFLGSAVGEAFPFTVKITFPDRTTTGCSPPAVAIATDAELIAIATAMASVKPTPFRIKSPPRIAVKLANQGKLS